MRRHLTSDTLAMALSLFVAGVGTGAEIPRIPLTVQASTTVDLGVGPYQVPIKCDGEGNLYVRPLSQTAPLAGPIIKVNGNGKQVGTYSFAGVNDLKTEDLQAVDFVVGQRGEIYALIGSPKGDFIVTFRPNGDVQSVTSLSIDRDLQLCHLARMPSGQYLITGVKSRTMEPQTLVVDGSGNVTQVIATGEKTPVDKQGGDRKTVAAFQLSDLVGGDDGNIYTMRPSPRPTLIVLSVLGEVLRTFVVDGPQGDYTPVTFVVGGGKIVINFEQRRAAGQSIARNVYRMINAYTGEVEYDYVPNSELWGALACYVPPNQFSILMPQENGRFRLQKATP